MPDPTIIRITPDELKQDPIRCRSCNQTNLTIYGKVYREFVLDHLADGGDDYRVDESNTYQEIDRILCKTCNILYMLESKYVQDLLRANFELSEALLKRTTSKHIQ